MDYPRIKAEIALPAYAGMSDADIAAALMAKTVTPDGHIDVPVGPVVGYLALQGKLAGLQAYVKAGTGSADGLVAASELLTLLTAASVGIFHTSDETVYDGIKNFLDALVADTANSGIVQADEDALLAMAQPASLPFARSANETIDAGAVQFARSLP